MRQKQHRFQLGEEIFIQMSANPRVEEDLFTCKGVVIRLPIQNRLLYKVAITSVANLSLTAGYRPDIAQRLVGKKVPRHQRRIIKTLAGWIEQKLDTKGWTDARPDQLSNIKNLVSRSRYVR